MAILKTKSPLKWFLIKHIQTFEIYKIGPKHTHTHNEIYEGSMSNTLIPRLQQY